MRRLLSILISIQAVAAAVLLACVTQAARAEAPAPACNPCRSALETLAPGAPVALLLRNGTTLYGAFVQLRTDTLVLRRARAHRRASLLEKPLAQVYSLSLEDQPRRQHNTVVGCVIGAVVGGLVGLRLGQAVADSDTGEGSGWLSLNLDPVFAPVMSTIGGALLGAGVGGLIGWAIDAAPAPSLQGSEILCE
jgi:hypothetical protein